MPLLFVYGTLREPIVQTRVLGRTVSGQPAMLPGWRRDWIPVSGYAAEIAGSTVHPAAAPDPDSSLDGLVLEILESDWAALDAYEGEPYQRIEVTLADGRAAHFYAARSAAQ